MSPLRVLGACCKSGAPLGSHTQCTALVEKPAGCVPSWPCHPAVRHSEFCTRSGSLALCMSWASRHCWHTRPCLPHACTGCHYLGFSGPAANQVPLSEATHNVSHLQLLRGLLQLIFL